MNQEIAIDKGVIMAWDRDRALARIQKFAESAPEAEILVEDFARDYFPRRTMILNDARKRGESTDPIVDIPIKKAILTDGVHVYANLCDFLPKLSDNSRETERTHERALQLLHLHYGACDRLIHAMGVQRVDFHAGRLHAVVLTPTGDENAKARLLKGVAFANAFKKLVSLGADVFGEEYRSSVRIGIDFGKAVAINSGRKNEPEPLFLGDPANAAAKLADGDEPGIFLSNNAETLLNVVALDGGPARHPLTEDVYRAKNPEASSLRDSSGALYDDRIAETIRDYEIEIKALREEFPTPANFRFHRHTPPLATIDFSEIPPSNAIRMELASVFADIDGFSDFVSRSIRTGDVGSMVAKLHVLRGEMSAVLRDDFHGRKVRFIGDCIHGLLAVGSEQETDATKTITEATKAAGGIRSSFELCQQTIGGMSELGIAIGLDYGPTPITRIGLRGEKGSVRCACSGGTANSESEQRRCNGTQTAIGENAYSGGGWKIRDAFGDVRIIDNLNFAAAVALFDGLSSPYVNTQETKPIQAYSE